MAKPTGFRHPVCPRSDDRIAALIGLHGPLGYGLYWMIIETMYREESMRLEYSDKQVRRMAAVFGAEIHSFRTLIKELTEDFDLLAVEDGYLVSTIVYRKPRKKKEPAADVPMPQATTDAVPLAETIPVVFAGIDDGDTVAPSLPATDKAEPLHNACTDIALPTPGKSEDASILSTKDSLITTIAAQRQQQQTRELQYYQELKDYIDLKAPRVAAMQQPLTPDQALVIRTSYRQDLLYIMLEEMQRSESLTKDFSSVPQALRAFATGREYAKARPRRSWKKPKSVGVRY